MLIRKAAVDDIPVINKLAHIIWRNTYRDILSAAQIDFMLNDMYSIKSLREQFSKGVNFLIAEADKSLGFSSYSFTKDISIGCKIHKLYVLPESQGKNIGGRLVNYIKEDAVQNGAEAITLNVNRRNPAVGFYLKCGFTIIEEVDIPYHDYVLNDYIMQMPLGLSTSPAE